jgi:hypothetical protein
MDTFTLQQYRLRAELPRRLIVGFLAGAISVLLFHQGALGLLHALGLAPQAPYSFTETYPLGIPQVWSLAFWGGVWGVLLAGSLAMLHGAGLVIVSTLYGMVFPTLVAWFIVAPLKGQPVAADFAPMAMAIGLIVNAAWGFGTGTGLALFGERRSA